ncbi:MAG: (2Fe-2S)-binding protein, partial [Chelatococcus sp.]|uniref:NAD(P)/FAD-dependent oxidoreductase n=1 Tax=Chelatococcus sp. TaxID=1953771 RepID=UPI0025B8A25B
GAGWMRRIQAAGVPWLWRHTITAAEGDETGVTAVTVAPIDAAGHCTAGGRKRRFEVDAVTVGHGLVPATEFLRALGARLEWNHGNDCWQPVKDTFGRTSIAGLYVAGDGAGVAGAAAAEVGGEIAALAAVNDLKPGAGWQITLALRRKQNAAARFGRASIGLTRMRPGLVAAIRAQTIVCRCEDVSRGTLDEAFGEGARSIGQIKAWTRCGMGPCQGRMCGETLSALASLHGIARETFEPMVGRAPARPVEIGCLTGVPDYESIPLPPSLPSS